MLHFYSIKGIKLAFVDLEIKQEFIFGTGLVFLSPPGYCLAMKTLVPAHLWQCFFFIDKDILCMNLALQSRDADKQRGWGTLCPTQP